MIPLNEVPANKQLLWFFDDEMTHDLIFIPSGIPHNNNYISTIGTVYDKLILVERATIYNYPPRAGWVEDFFYALLPHSKLIKPIGQTFTNDAPTKKYIINIPAVSSENVGKKLIIVYHIPEVKLIKNRVVQIFHLHHKFVKLSSFPRTITIDCLIASGHAITDVESIKNSINNQLKDTIEFNFEEEAKTLISSYSTFNYDGTCELISFAQSGSHLGVTNRVHIGSANYTSNFSESLEAATYPEQGAIIYAYPNHPALKHRRIDTNLTIGDVALFDVDYDYIVAKYNNEKGAILTQNHITSRGFGNLTQSNYSEEINYVSEFCKGIGYLNRIYEDSNLSNEYSNRVIQCEVTSVHPEVNLDGYVGYSLGLATPIGKTATCLAEHNYFNKEFLTKPLTLIKGDPPANWLIGQENYHNRIEFFKNYYSSAIKNKILPIYEQNNLYNWIYTTNFSNSSLTNFIDSFFLTYPDITLDDFFSIIESVNYEKSFIKQLGYRDVYTSNDKGSGGYIKTLYITTLAYPANTFHSISGGYSSPFRDYYFYENYLVKYLEEMNQNLLLQEIHACLGAGEFAYQDNGVDTPSPAYMSIGRRVDLLCKSQGILFDLSGKMLSIRQSKKIPQGEFIPVGWNFGQFGLNTGDGKAHNDQDYSGQNGGAPDEERLGIVYQVKSNELVLDSGTGDEQIISRGGYILCESWPQYYAIMERDLDKAIDWQNLGAGVITFNGKTQVTEGLFDILQEISIVGADTNKTTEQARIATLITQQLAKEILKALGVPTIVKKFDFVFESNNLAWIQFHGTKEVEAEVPYNGIADESPTMMSMFISVLENIAAGNIDKFKLKNEEIIKQSPIQDYPDQIVPINKGFPVINFNPLQSSPTVDIIVDPVTRTTQRTMFNNP